MRKILLFIAFIILTLNVSAQNKKNEQKAKSEVEYVTSKMKLNNSEEKVVYDALIFKYIETSKLVKDLPKEQRKPIYKEQWTIFQNTLKETFSQKDTKKIISLIKEKKQMDKKK